jgi:hypothetical protein
MPVSGCKRCHEFAGASSVHRASHQLIHVSSLWKILVFKSNVIVNLEEK